MIFSIQKMTPNDKSEVLAMMQEFYSSDAVFTNGSADIFKEDFENCIKDNPYLEGFMFKKEEKI